MIARLAKLSQVRLRLVDAVAIAAVAVLVLKLSNLLAAPPEPAPAQAGRSGVVEGREQLPPFFRAIANARSNYLPPDVTMTGAVPDKKPEKKPEEKAKPDAPEAKRIPFDAAPQAASPAERALLERLGERREEIQQKERELEMRERLLESAEKRIESRLNELKGAEEKANDAAGKKGDSEAAAIRNLVTMYETMKPKDAARVFDRLPHDVLVPVVAQMNPRKMAEILAVMSPEAAERLTVALATRGRPPAQAAAAAAALPPNELPAIEPPAPAPTPARAR